MEELILPGGAVVEIDPSDFEVEVEGLGVVVAHANKADSRLIERFKKAVYRAFTRAVGEEVTLAENMLWEVLISRYIDHAAGESLHFLGARVGEPWQGQADPEYRVRVRARILINNSRGLPEDLLGVLRALGIAGSRYTNLGHASQRIDLGSYHENQLIRVQVAGLVGEAAAAGVGTHVTAAATASEIDAMYGSVYVPEMGAIYGSAYDPDAGSGVFGHSVRV